MQIGQDVPQLDILPSSIAHFLVVIFFLGVQKKNTVSRSSTKAEYRSMAHNAIELTWLTFILRDLKVPLQFPLILFCDNLNALHMTVNPVVHARSKHIELDYHFIQERIVLGQLVTRHVSSVNQLADIFTKALPKLSLYSLRSKLCFQPHNLREGISRYITWRDKEEGHVTWSDKVRLTTQHKQIQREPSSVKSVIQG